MKFTKKELKVIEMLLSNKDLTTIILTTKLDSDEIASIEAKFNTYRKINKPPAPQYALAQNCDILHNGRVINTCRELTNGSRNNQPWLRIEVKCLACLITQNKTTSQSKLHTMCNEAQIVKYFDREPKAIYAMALKIIKS